MSQYSEGKFAYQQICIIPPIAVQGSTVYMTIPATNRDNLNPFLLIFFSLHYLCGGMFTVTHGVKIRASDPLELESQMVMSHEVYGVWGLDSGLLKELQAILTA